MCAALAAGLGGRGRCRFLRLPLGSSVPSRPSRCVLSRPGVPSLRLPVQNQVYGLKLESAYQVVTNVGASDLAREAFFSGTSAHLRVCEKYWSAQDSAPKKHSGGHKGLMWIHCSRVDIPREVAKIRKDRTKAVLVVSIRCTEEECSQAWMVSLTNMSQNKALPPAGESVYEDNKRQPMPPERWPTKFHYAD